MVNSSIYAAFERMWQHIIGKLDNYAPTAVFDNHTSNIENPHAVTAEQVGAYTTKEVDNKLASLDYNTLTNLPDLDQKSNIDHQHTASEVGALPITGGIMEDVLTLRGIVLTEGIDYGSGDPGGGVLGQLYFKKVT